MTGDYNLGVVAVLDAQKLSEGMHISIDGQILVVTRIEGEAVFIRPLSTRERWFENVKKYRLAIGILMVIGLFFAVRMVL